MYTKILLKPNAYKGYSDLFGCHYVIDDDIISYSYEFTQFNFTDGDALLSDDMIEIDERAFNEEEEKQFKREMYKIFGNVIPTKALHRLFGKPEPYFFIDACQFNDRIELFQTEVRSHANKYPEPLNAHIVGVFHIAYKD